MDLMSLKTWMKNIQTIHIMITQILIIKQTDNLKAHINL